MARKKKNMTSDGRFQKSFTFNGKRYFVRANDRETLDEKIRQKREELENGKVERENPTIKTFYEKWKDNRAEVVTEATRRIQQCHYNTICKIEIDGKISPSHLVVESGTYKIKVREE